MGGIGRCDFAEFGGFLGSLGMTEKKDAGGFWPTRIVCFHRLS